MKRLIVKYNRVIRREEMDKIETKVQKEWKEREAVILPECCDYEIIEDGENEVTKFLDHEIAKRKAAVEEEGYYKETCESLQKTIVKLNEIVQEQGLKLREYEKAAVKEFCNNLNNDYDEVDQFVCSECDIRLEGWHRIDYDEGEKEYFEYTLKYCPNCGKKIRSTQ
jgi:hypothetical protein